MPGYDYATPNYYFITICTHGRRQLFWSKGQLNRFGKIAYDTALQIEAHFPKNRVDSFVIMPNHIHMILVVEPGGTDVRVVMGLYKSQVSKEIHKLRPEIEVWQISFHDHGIRSYKQYLRIRSYIETNPIRWKEDRYFES